MKSAIKITTFVLLAVAFGASLAGCSKEDDDRLQGGTQPVTLTATVEGQSASQAAQAATRATADNTWAGGEEVAVQIGGEVKKYTAATDGTLTVESGVEPWYWQKTTETKAVEAWHAATYFATKPASFTVAADQSSTEGYQQSDMLYADATISYLNHELEFHHLPVKVVVNLKKGDGITEAEVQSAIVTLVGQNLTSGAIAANWTVTKLTTSGSETITPNVLAAPTVGFLKTVQAIVVPQQSTASVRFIKVSVAGQEFFYSAVLDFGTGRQRTYNITVQKSGLSVTASGAEAWTGTTTDVTSVDIYTDKDLKMGDYYYSDGTYSDGGLRKRYADGTFEKEDIAPDGSKTVCGIVFFRRDASAPNDAGGYTEFSGTPTGYIVGLDENTSQWNNQMISDNRFSSSDIINGYSESYTVTNNQSSIAITWCKNHTNISNTSTITFSSWYMISIKELNLLANAISLINGNITRASGTVLDSKFYSTANRMGSYGDYLFVLNPITMDNNPGDYENSLTHDFSYRAACAFQLK